MSKMYFLLLAAVSFFLCTNVAAAQTNSPVPRPVQIDGRWGYIDQKGQIVIAPQFSWAEEFSEDLAAFANDDGMYGYIDTAGKVVIPPVLTRWSEFREGLAAVAVEFMNWGYIDKTGAWVVKPQFAYAQSFQDGLAVVKLRPDEGKTWTIGMEPTSIIDRSGKQVFKPIDGVVNARTSKGLVLIQHMGSSWNSYLMDLSGKVILEAEEIDMHGFVEGLAAVKVRGKWGYIDQTGTFVIQPRFDNAREFSEGLAPVGLGKKWGYIDHTGKMVIEPKFTIDEVGDVVAYTFAEGLAKAYLDNNTVYIDTKGKVVFKPDVTDAGNFWGAWPRSVTDTKTVRNSADTWTSRAGMCGVQSHSYTSHWKSFVRGLNYARNRKVPKKSWDLCRTTTRRPISAS